jgi:hypothetical protein
LVGAGAVDEVRRVGIDELGVAVVNVVTLHCKRKLFLK